MFDFKDSEAIGEVLSVETSRVMVRITESEKLQQARVGRLVIVRTFGDEWLVGLIDKVWRYPVTPPNVDGVDDLLVEETVPVEENGMLVSLVGTYRSREGASHNVFTRAVWSMPEIGRPVFGLEGKVLEAFMNIISSRSKSSTTQPLELGTYTIDGRAKAFLDGNRLFQRHAAILGSTGSGKSWTVATLLEVAARLPNANIIIFDLHGEYQSLSFAKHYRIAGPNDLKEPDDNVLFLPYWLLSYEDMQALFIDRSEFSAHNQASIFHDKVKEAKRKALVEMGADDVLQSFTIDSPVPFDFNEVQNELERLNEEMVPGSSGREKQGPFHGNFSRLLIRLDLKRNDRRYGFIYQVPENHMEYESLHELAGKLMGFGCMEGTVNNGIKVIDFSDVPSDVLPVIVSLVARLVFQIQFWCDPGPKGDGRHPLLLVCDEAHLYLPKKENMNPLERRALDGFERIAKEGRKYGVALLVVSQRPSDVSTTILSQCNNFISLRLTNRLDQAVVKQMMPETLEGLLDVLPTLDVGEAVVVGDSVLLPSRIKINPPTDKPLSSTIDFWDEWTNKAQQSNLEEAVENYRRQARK